MPTPSARLTAATPSTGTRRVRRGCAVACLRVEGLRRERRRLCVHFGANVGGYRATVAASDDADTIGAAHGGCLCRVEYLRRECRRLGGDSQRVRRRQRRHLRQDRGATVAAHGGDDADRLTAEMSAAVRLPVPAESSRLGGRC